MMKNEIERRGMKAMGTWRKKKTGEENWLNGMILYNRISGTNQVTSIVTTVILRIECPTVFDFILLSKNTPGSTMITAKVTMSNESSNVKGGIPN
jgi:hypothetical protein